MKPWEMQWNEFEMPDEKEKKDRLNLSDIEGGKYNRQVTNGLLLEN